MATINATINISSDIMSYPISIEKTMSMKKLTSAVGLDETTGLRTKKFTATTAAVIVEHDELTDDKAHKVYIKGPHGKSIPKRTIKVGSRYVKKGGKV